MSHAIITVLGGAEACSQELEELGIKNNAKGTDYCTANLSKEQLKIIQVSSQTAIRVLQLIGVGKREQLAALSQLCSPTGSFAVRASGTDRQELQEELGGIIHETTGAPVNLEAPDALYYVHETEGEYLLGIDLLGDLHKRHYKIMTGSQSLTGPLAACVLRIAGWTPEKDLVVWPCVTGELAIEAALWAAKKSPRAYELKMLDYVQSRCKITAADPRLSMVRSTEKNAKVAGINQYLSFSRQDVDWLDTKYKESSVEFFISLLPNLKLQPKIAKELAYQLDFILKHKGIVLLICINDENASAAEEAFAGYELSRYYVWMGKHALTLVKAQKTKTTKK